MGIYHRHLPPLKSQRLQACAAVVVGGGGGDQIVVMVGYVGSLSCAVQSAGLLLLGG